MLMPTMRFIPPALLLTLGFVCGCDDQPEAPPPSSEKSAPAQRMDDAKKEIDGAQKALDERGDHIAEQSNAQ